MKISRRTCRNIFLLSLLLSLPIVGVSQNIDIASGLDQVKGHLQTVNVSAKEIVLYLLSIASLAGLCKTVYGMYTEEHGNSWQKALMWLGIFLFAVIALYVSGSFAP